MKYKIKAEFLRFQLLQLAKLVLDVEESAGMDRDDIMTDLCIDDSGEQKHMLHQVRKILRGSKL